jgi:GntR family transcriptional regulator, transcriptional repressor for pyruvate dehydrogenase complex
MSEPVTFDRVGRMPRLSDTIAEQLLEAIVAGRFTEGDVLPSERELGDQFGVSRTVIREAVRALATRGVVEVQSGRGVRVKALDTESITEAMSLLLRGDSAIDFAKVHEVRLMLETHLAGLAAQRSTPEDHEELERLMNAWVAAGDDVETASRIDVDFHRAIAKCARNELFLVLLDSIAGALLENRRATLALEHSRAKVLAEHRNIVAGIRVHDPELARSAMETHLAGVAEAWQAQQVSAEEGA